jgi:trehalose/maltose transport system substrate-binding protein
MLAGAVMCLLAPLLLTVAACEKKSTEKKPEPVTIVFFGWAPGTHTDFEIDQSTFQRFTEETGIQVRFIATPESVTDRLPMVLELLNKKAPTPDVYYVDVIWPGLLADHLLDLKSYWKEEAEQYFRELIRNNTVNGRLVGIPFDNGAGILYYRTDLLRKYGYDHPPGDWDELEKMAARIQAGERAAGNRNFWGFVWQGAPYEGLTCNALEWQVSFGGGRIIEPDGTITVNNPHTVKALKKAKGWVGTISPPSVTSYKEDDSQNAWVAGNAAFIRVWAFNGFLPEPAEHSPLKGKFAATLLPSRGARHASTLGGQLLRVSKYSAHPSEDIAFVRYMTSRGEESRRWYEGLRMPTIREFYDDPQVLKTNSDIARMKQVFTDAAVARPSAIAGKHYDEVSRAYFTAVHNILTGKTEAEKALADLESKLVKITGFRTGRPPESDRPAEKAQ